MGLFRKRTERKAFVEPPFWSQPELYWSSVGDRETLEADWIRYIRELYKANGIVYAAIQARGLVFSEARFAFRRLDQGRPTELFTSSDLAILEKPWTNGTTGELLMRMEQDASLAGNFYATVVNGQLRRLRPDRVTIITGRRNGDTSRPFALDAVVLGYIYAEPGTSLKELLTPEQVIHYSPIPDPEAQWRGMSWLSPIIEEVQSDRAATRLKMNFYRRGYMPGSVVTYDPTVDQDTFNFFVESFKKQHEGVDNAFRTLHLGGGADLKTMGVDLQKLDMKAIQGAGETRIAAAAGVPAVVLGISEGLAGSSLNTGNYSAARRRFADGTIRPLWRIAAASLEAVVNVPTGAQLWYDDRDVAFLRDDAKDEAAIRSQDASTINTLIQAGFKPDGAVDAVMNGDLRRLIGQHSGLAPVQVQPVQGDPNAEQ